MKSLRSVLLVLVVALVSGCSHYSDINGKVVDNATGKPIEGAVIVAVWIKQHGFGLTYGTLSKSTETLTDKEGSFKLTGINDPFVDPPYMLIYKEGYIPWRNDAIFPSANKAKDYEWKNNITYKLDIFTDKYTTGQLDFFLFLPTHMAEGSNAVPMYEEVRRKISSKYRDELFTQQKNKWLIEIRTLFESLEKGSYSAYPDFRDKLTDKNFEMDWILGEAEKEISDVSIVMKNNGIIVEHKPVGSSGAGSKFITKK